MKVLFISHALQRSGWGQAARDYILAMDSVGIDVVPRYVVVNGETTQLPERILELEKQSAKDCDVCIQFLLPHLMKYDIDGFEKCIALYDYECSNFRASGWPQILSNFDEVWTPCSDGISSDISATQYVVPHAIDLTKFDVPFKKVVDGQFFFYFIGEANPRKNLAALIKAFNIEFGIDENVGLIIKTSKEGTSPQGVAQGTIGLIEKIKEMLKLYPNQNCYKREVVVADYLSHEQMVNLHKSCHCFVMPSHGEAMCLPAMDALAVGNPIICSKTGGLKDLVELGIKSDNAGNGLLVPGQQVPVEGMLDTFNDLSTGFETWFDISVPQLRNAMRSVYEGYKYYDKEHIKSTVTKFSHQNIGNRILEVLSGNAQQKY